MAIRAAAPVLGAKEGEDPAVDRDSFGTLLQMVSLGAARAFLTVSEMEVAQVSLQVSNQPKSLAREQKHSLEAPSLSEGCVLKKLRSISIWEHGVIPFAAALTHLPQSRMSAETMAIRTKTKVMMV